MVRFKLDIESTELLDRITNIYNFKRDTITGRIALSLSLEKGQDFLLNDNNLSQNGREYTPTSNIFGRLVNDVDNFVLYKAIFDQHYKKELSENDFIKLYKFHLKDGLQIWNNQLNNIDITKGEHISLLLRPLKKGLTLRSKTIKTSSNIGKVNVKEFNDLLTFDIGETEENEVIEIRINDLREFDNRNIAIAGMAGSGKTQLIKDILYQISRNTNNELKFIFFDYKGEGNPSQLKTFLEATNSQFVDIVNDGGVEFNPFLSINLDEKQKPFSIRAFVDTISAFVPKMGVNQANILISLIDDLLDRKKGEYPTILDLFQELENYYEEKGIKQDTLFSVIRDLSTNIFNCDPNTPDILSKSLYLNLPPALSDTLRQLVVFLLLRYFNSYFSSTNDCEPKDNIFPLRYVIVIDEAHIYLKNRNARKALEDLLRLLRSKGVIVIMLSQGVEDYKTKDFDFASQVKLPICLNVQNKDYKAITSFIGTSNSKVKLESELRKLDSGKGLINIKEPKIINLRQFWKTINNS
ncbi:DndE family protein [Flavobacterium rakeshii]|uniref:DndE family protein n=1 Tax=Flavobacterium rakeshii TaxID=1038845 RepID=UPI002E7B3E2F|nr:DndE family protein [Flavobacterium rakeshii]MEE1897450.1 DndE family protein [Flavobacterium rakeshii]